jgi:GNAT superfamily N-acetyltransferase
LEIHIEGPYFDKADICIPIVRALPDWFGIEASILHYATEINILPTFLAIEASRTIGFLSIKQHTPYSAEVYVMAVLPEVHHQGVGRSLMSQAQAWLKRQNIQYLQVKTLGPSDPDEKYAKTRLFYEAMGFSPLEEFKQIWDEDNPCLIMVKKL